MAALLDRLRGYVNTTGGDDPVLVASLSEASALIGAYTAGSEIPKEIADRATLEVASELFHRRNAPHGVAQWGADGEPIRVSRDPMTPAYPLLRPFLPGGFA